MIISYQRHTYKHLCDSKQKLFYLFFLKKKLYKREKKNYIRK